jgi:PAS domain S-box-containing protein
VRASGSAAALQDDHWAELVAYEEQVQSSIHAQKLIALCSYPLGKCSASEFLQAVNSHDCALVRRQGGWECIDNKIGNQLIDRLVEKEHALASSISPMVITDLAGQITYSNPAALTAWGYDSDSEVLQRPVTEFISDPETLMVFIERVRANGSCVGELVATRRDGSTFEVEVLGSLSFDYQGQPIGMVASCLDMTGRKEAESRRKESEDRYRTLVENIGLGITLLDRDHRILAVNSVHADMIGRSVDQCVGQECFRVFEKREHVCPHCPGTRAMETGEAHEVETVGIRDDGTTYAARVQAFPVHDADSGVTGFIEVVEDLTDRKRLEETLHLSQHCVEQAGDGIFWIDPSGRIIFANQRACEVLGYSQDEICSLTVFDIDLSVTPDIWQPRWEKIREQRTLRLESRHRTKTGRTFAVEVSVTHLDCDGKEYHCAFVRDISDRKRVEEQLAHYSAIVTSNQDAIIGVILDGTITSWNPGAERLYGYTADEMIGHSVTRLAPPERSHETISILSNLSHNGGSTPFDTVRCRKDGTRVDVSLSISPIKDSHGRIVGASTTGHEITDRKRAEQELVVAKVAAEAANEAKSEFLANMSHEIRTPMSAILGFADILLARAEDEESAEICQIIKRNGDQLLQVINDILDLSKIEAGRLDLDLQTCSLRQIVSDVITTMQVRADAKGLHLSVEYHGEESDEIQTSPTRLRQILINLIGNAIKFTELGGVRVVVNHAPACDMWRCVRFDVIDSGIGIDENHLEELFQPFSQVDASSCRRFGGTGLGLTISRRLARMLGGDITSSSMLGEGSTFTATVSTGLVETATAVSVASEASWPRW